MRFTGNHPIGRRPLPALAGLGVIVVAAALVPAALGAAPTPKTPQEKVMVDYAACMRAKGISDFPDPVRGANGVLAFPKLSQSYLSQPKLKAAAQTCAATARASFRAGRGGFGGVRNSAAFQKFTACLKQNGVTLPQRGAGPRDDQTGPVKKGTTPLKSSTGSQTPGQRRPGFGFGQSNNPAYQKAFAKCRQLLPARPAGAPAGQSG